MLVSAYRTVPVTPAPSVYGVQLSAWIQRWPAGEPFELLDYSIDVGQMLQDVDDTIAAVAVDIRPSGLGERAIVAVEVAGALITTFQQGGVPGRDYVVRFQGLTVGGLAFEWQVHVLIDPCEGPSPPPIAPSTGYGPQMIWPTPWIEEPLMGDDGQLLLGDDGEQLMGLTPAYPLLPGNVQPLKPVSYRRG